MGELKPSLARLPTVRFFRGKKPLERDLDRECDDVTLDIQHLPLTTADDGLAKGSNSGDYHLHGRSKYSHLRRVQRERKPHEASISNIPNYKTTTVILPYNNPTRPGRVGKESRCDRVTGEAG